MDFSRVLMEYREADWYRNRRKCGKQRNVACGTYSEMMTASSTVLNSTSCSSWSTRTAFRLPFFSQSFGKTCRLADVPKGIRTISRGSATSSIREFRSVYAKAFSNETMKWCCGGSSEM